MNPIPKHTLSVNFPGEIAFLRHVPVEEEMPSIDYAHRDDYYIFLFLEKGSGKFLIDFKECELSGEAIHCILPGQVHFPTGHVNATGWILLVDSVWVKEEYKVILQKAGTSGNSIKLTGKQKEDLNKCITVLAGKLNTKKHPVDYFITGDLVSAYVGMIAGIYQENFPVAENNRAETLSSQFRTLLADNYRFLKMPSQYASRMNISPAYLNEAVKKTTGLTVSEHIKEEIVLQAKRLLFYTRMSIKEIALELGYEDWAYFTRLFTKATSLSPSRFRQQYLK